MFSDKNKNQIRATLRKELAIMKDTIKYVGLNVSKEKIAVAIANEGRGEPREDEAIRDLVREREDAKENVLSIVWDMGAGAVIL
jgi:hypothetical protein